ncbi:hypothetical protein [Streptomyces sp. NBC_01563]|uniref:hypothetical protein n=1 Tax=Streptomyces sp. NBC_01563 TaxID=2975880 RepID=UPI0038699CB2
MGINETTLASWVSRAKRAGNVQGEALIRIAWITDFCNTRLRHSVCDFKGLIACEREYWASFTVGLAG